MDWKRRAAAGVELATRAKPLRRVARAVTQAGFAPPGALPFMHTDRQFTVSLPASGETFVYEGGEADAVARQLYWTGLSTWEAESWREFVPLARRARCFVDVGAFTGTYTLVAAAVNPSLTAMAFEPVPHVYECLVRNIELNRLADRVTTWNAAVSSSVGSARFFIPDRDMPDTGFLETSARRSLEAGTWHEVPTTTLAAAMEGRGRVDLMKIDVEDADVPVIAAMADVIADHRPTILVEFLSTGTYSEAHLVLAGLGYDFFHLTDAGRVPVATPKPDDLFFNFLCVPRT